MMDNTISEDRNIKILEVKDRAYDSLSQFMSSEIKLEEALNNILDLIVDFFNIKAGSIFLLDSSKNIMDFSVTRGDRVAALRNIQIKKGEGIAGKVALTGESIIANNTSQNTDFNRVIGNKVDYIPLKILCVPLKVKSSTYGVIEIMDKRSGEDFINEDLDLLKDMADPISIMIENISLFTTKENDIKRLSTFVQINKNINTAMNFQALLEYIMSSAKGVLESEGSSLLLLDNKTDELYFNVVENDSDRGKILKEIRVPVGTGIAGIVAKTGEPLIINDAENDNRVFRKADEMTNLKTRNILAVPIRVQEQIIGVLEVINSSAKKLFGQADLQVLQSMADQAGIAINNRNLIENLQSSNVSLAKRIKELTAINRISLLIGRNMDYDIQTIFTRTIEIISEVLEVERISLFLLDEKSNKPKLIDARGIDTTSFDELSLPLPSKIMDEVFKTSNPVLIDNISKDSKFGKYKRFRYRTRSFLSLPLRVKQKVVGVINLSDKKNGAAFDKDDLQTLETIAMQISETYENALFYQEIIDKQRIERELEVANKIQQSILPSSFPTEHGFDIAASSIPALEIGGDFYDMTDCGNGRYAVYIADVSGKGIPAALFMAFSHSALRIVSGSALAPAAVLQKANDFIFKDSRKGMFVTLFYLLIDTSDKTFSYGSAGHNEQLYFDSATGEITLMKSHGVPLGILANRTFQEIHKEYKPGDFIVLYTDGVLDAINTKRDDYTLERLQSIVLANRDLSAAKMLETIKSDVEQFCGEVNQFDDLTLMIIKFN